MRILAMNVQNLEGDSRRQNILHTELRRLSPDLVALQEVIQSEERRQLDELLADTGLEATHQAQVLAYDPPWVDRSGGTAIASRWPHQVVEALDLRLLDIPWCTLAAVVDIPGAGEMLFIGTTASWRLDAEPGSAHAHPKAHCRVVSAELVFDRDFDGVWASDHFGVLVEAEVGND